jgi:hypothetical protein
LVVFGGHCGLSHDDLADVGAMIKAAPSALRKSFQLERSLLFQLSYQQFENVSNAGKMAFDLVRGHTVNVARLERPKLFAEVFTSKHWLVRIWMTL